MQNMFNFKVVQSSGNGSYYDGGYNTATYSSIAMAHFIFLSCLVFSKLFKNISAYKVRQILWV